MGPLQPARGPNPSAPPGCRRISRLRRSMSARIAAATAVSVLLGTVAAQAALPSPTCTALGQKLATMTHPNSRELNVLLMNASEGGCLDLSRRLLEIGASPRAANQAGDTALILAARAGEEDMVRLLLDSGAAIHHRNLKGATALLAALTANRKQMASFLLERGADPSLGDKDGVTPLAAAAFNGDRQSLERLLERGVEANPVDRSGKSPIVYAAARGFAAIVERLLDAGAPVNARYGHDLTALAWAAGHANDAPVADGVETVTLLLDRGADQNLADDRGRTPLMIAAGGDHPEIVALLLSRGGDALRRDGDGKMASDLAASAAVADALARN